MATTCDALLSSYPAPADLERIDGNYSQQLTEPIVGEGESA